MVTKALTKNQLIEKLATDAGQDKKQAKAFIEALTAHVQETVKSGGVVKLQDLGQFKVRKSNARMGRNPQTGEPIQIPARTTVKFYVAKALKDSVKE